jgi:hypothetical protein
MCVGGGGVGFGFNGFVIKVQPFLMDGHYRTDITSGARPLEIGLNRATNVMYGSVQWSEDTRHCTASPLGQHQPY